MSEADVRSVRRVEVGVPGFDHVAEGGIPEGRSTLLAGTAGCGKTIFGVQFLVEGIRKFDETGVLVTFEELPDEMIRNVDSLGWDVGEFVDTGKLVIVDATSDPGEETIEAGRYDFSAFMARIEHAIRSVSARRVVLDAVGSVFSQFTDAHAVRTELHRVAVGLRRLGVTSIMTVERNEEDGAIARFGVEEFVADNVMILRNRLHGERRRRTLEILKFRGATHQKGEFPFTIDPTDGITVLPLSAIELTQRSSEVRITSGNRELDLICHGGFFRDSVVLVSGATGTGKTLMTTEFLNGGIKSGERVLLLAFEESRHQLFRNARSWGVDYEQAEADGLLRVIARYPETMGLEDHLIRIKRDIDAFQPQRVALDSLSALERVATGRTFREFVIGVTSFVKERELAALFTNTTGVLMGSESVTDSHISTTTDAIILLRYVELHGEIRRGIAVLKMRGSLHDKEIREYFIDGEGMHVSKPFRRVHGILSGVPTYSFYDKERSDLGGMFEGAEGP